MLRSIMAMDGRRVEDEGRKMEARAEKRLPALLRRGWGEKWRETRAVMGSS